MSAVQHHRTHCRLCGQLIAAGERHYTLTVPFGPMIGVEHEECPPVTTNASAPVAPGGTAAWTRADREHLAWLQSLPASPEVERSIAATEERIMEMERGRPHEGPT